MARHTRAPLAVLFLVNVLNYYDRQALGAVAEPLRREFALSDAQIGALSTVFIVVYALAGLPLGRLADTWSRRKLMAIGVSVWAGLTALGAAAASYGMLAATRLGVGIGEAVCAPAANSWIGAIVPAGRRARAMAGFMMAVPVGVMLSSAVTGPAAQAWGWRAALALAAAPAVLLVPALLWLREPEREAVSRAEDRTGPMSLLRIPALGVDRGIGRHPQFRALQFLLVPAGVPEALSRTIGGAGGVVDGPRLGRGGRGGRGACGNLGRSHRRPLVERAPVAGGGRRVASRAAGIGGDSASGGRIDRRAGIDHAGLWAAADILWAGVRRHQRHCGAGIARYGDGRDICSSRISAARLSVRWRRAC
jgi:MFS family permease